MSTDPAEVIHRNVAHFLADLFQNKHEIRFLLSDADFSLDEFDPPTSMPIRTWWRYACHELAKQDGVAAVLGAVLDRFPDNPEKKARIGELVTGLAQLGRVSPGVETLRRRLTGGPAPAAEELRRRVYGTMTAKVSPHYRGRGPELETLQKLLTDPEKRVIVLHGRRGMGKTQLVRKFLCAWEGSGYRSPPGLDAVVSLGLHEEKSRSPDTIVKFLGPVLGESAACELNAHWKLDTTVEHKLVVLFQIALEGRRIVVVLQGFDQVLDSSNDIAPAYADLKAFLGACLDYGGGTRLLLVGSRPWVPPAEWKARYGSELGSICLDHGLSEADSLDLLRSQAEAVQLDLPPVPEALLREVVRKLQGIPLSLERLVQTLPSHLGPRRIEDLLGDDAFLAAIREQPARELYESLTPEQREVVQALAVFGRPVPAEAVRRLLPDPRTDERLHRLHASRVVLRDTEGYVLRLMDRDYVYGRLAREAAPEALRRLHVLAARHFWRQRKKREQWRAAEDLEPQLHELEHRVRAEQYYLGHRILYGIENEHLTLWGQSAQVVEMRLQLTGKFKKPWSEGVNWRCLGLAYYDLGKLREAVECHRKSLAIGNQLNNNLLKCAAHNNLGMTFNDLGEPEKALESFREARPLVPKGKDDWLGNVVGNQGDAHRLLGEVHQAIECYEEALRTHRRAGYSKGEAVWLGNLMMARHDLGDLAGALDYFRQAQEVVRRTSNGTGRGSTWPTSASSTWTWTTWIGRRRRSRRRSTCRGRRAS
jgi:tetratricopeptide (TPR) repeat protein